MIDSASSRIYLDNNATTPVLPEVVDAMLPYMRAAAGNASSLHREGRLARRALETAREQIAAAIDASPSQVIFTSGGTEANNLAIFGLAGTVPCIVATSTVEHPSVAVCFDKLRTVGFDVRRLPVDRCGVIQSNPYAALLDSSPRLISVMLANNETGTLQPIAQLAGAARSRGASIHTDAVQAVGKIAVSFRSLGVNALSFSAHKFHGPVGIGALAIDGAARIGPRQFGGQQELGFRAGTEPVALIVGMAKALELALENIDRDGSRVRALTDRLVAGICDAFPGVVTNGSDHRVPNTVSLQFRGVDAQSVVIALDLAGVACSTGSACSSGAATPSPALLAMELDERQARSSIRFSLNRVNTSAEIERAIGIITDALHRAIPPVFPPSEGVQTSSRNTA